VPVRKAGKLPPPTVRRAYQLEYGSAELEVPVDVLDGKRVLLVDDVLATGGTLRAAADLLTSAGGELAAMAVIVELEALNGRAGLTDLPPLTALLRT
jgi:adenine phosphoribosyltransferase